MTSNGKTRAVMRIAPVAAAVLLLGALSPVYAETQRMLFDFEGKKPGADWLTVNDNVMGGVSKGGLKFEKPGILKFSGVLSLENRGGFSSIRSRRRPMDLSDYTGLVVRVKGDGRRYRLTLSTNVRIPAGSYQLEFNSVPGKWREVYAPFADFRATSFGRELRRTAPLDPAKIESAGFLIADKKAGPFSLEVDWIKAYGAPVPEGSSSAPGGSGAADIVDTAVAAGKFKTLIAALKAAGLVDALRGKGPLTVFAPTDEAFAKLPDGVVEDLLKPENKKKLVSILTYHVVPGRLSLQKRSAKSLEGSTLTVLAGGTLTVQGAEVLKADIEASNGVIHVIDAVLLPKPVMEAGGSEVREIIELAINRGVPLFNNGQVEACKAVYEVTAQCLLRLGGEKLTKQQRAALATALEKVAEGGTDRQGAWTLRRALDAVYLSSPREGTRR